MITRRSFAELSSLERQLLRIQRIQSGQCVRCFHASFQQRANENRTPSNTPNRGSKRQQRAAMISNEVEMLQKGPPGDPTSGPGSVTGRYQSDPPAPTTSTRFAETPHSMDGERMGENVSTEGEGPNAQGVGRLTGSDERVRNEHPTASSARTSSEIQEPAEGGTSVLEASTPGPASQAVRVARSKTSKDIVSSREWPNTEEAKLRNKLEDVKPLGVPFRPEPSPSKQILRSGTNAATPGGNNFEGVVMDRFKTVVSPAEALHSRPRAGILPKETKQRIINALVAGRYDAKGILSGKEQYKQPTMNEVAKRLMLNGTYLAGDGKRFLDRIQGLLPTAARPSQNASVKSQVKA